MANEQYGRITPLERDKQGDTIGLTEELSLKNLILDAITKSIVICDLNGNLVYTNRAACELLGISKDKTTGDKQPGLDVLRNFHIDENKFKTLCEKGILNFESRHISLDKHLLHISVHAAIVESGGKKLILCTIRDVSARFALEQQLVQSAKMSSLGTMAAGVAHEIKNPLAIIIQGADFLETALSDDSALFDVIKMIKQSSLRADKIIKDLLSFTRQTEMENEQADLDSVIEETLSLVERQFSLRATNIIRQYKHDLPMISMDSARIKQVFLNVLLNAIEAMQEGGTITISTDKIKGPEAKDFLRITFKDTGCGISRENIQNIFDPFFSTKTKSGGTGLGLSVSRGIIENHNGYIGINSMEGKGTEVTIDLPCGK